ncbi:ankyrin [Xylaria palmicola]|nr:ankyrin [Xylaria palmicola]
MQPATFASCDLTLLLLGLFKTYIDYAIFRFRLLSQLDDPPLHIALLPQSKRTEQASFSYARSYIAYQVLWENSTTSFLGRIGRAAKALCEEDGNTGDEAISACTDSLVHLAMGADLLTVLRKLKAEGLDECTDRDLKADIAVAAIYLGKHSYVESLMIGGVEGCAVPDVRSTVFGTAFHAAAMQGNVGMIELLLSHIAEYRDEGVLPVRRQHQILLDASKHGRQAAFDFALDKRPINLPREEPEPRWNPDIRVLRRVLQTTPSPPNYERVAAILGPNSKVFKRSYCGWPTGWLRCRAGFGDVEMVHYFLDRGANPNFAKGVKTYTPLLSAIKTDNKSIVGLLLEAGADPNIPHPPHSPLMYAIWKGNLSVVKLLLGGLTDVNEGSPPPIILAVFKERLDLFRLLREHGARLDTPETGGWAMAVAKLHGLSSMIDVLVCEGVNQDVVLHQAVPAGQWHWWYGYLWPRIG